MLYLGQCISSCPDRFFKNSSNQCSPCSLECAKCSETASNCVSCVYGQLYQGKCASRSKLLKAAITRSSLVGSQQTISIDLSENLPPSSTFPPEKINQFYTVTLPSSAVATSIKQERDKFKTKTIVVTISFSTVPRPHTESSPSITKFDLNLPLLSDYFYGLAYTDLSGANVQLKNQ